MIDSHSNSDIIHSMKATIIKITAKCSDLFSATVIDEKGNVIKEYDGYVPKFFPGEHFGDYVELDIELATGKILNWRPPTQKDISSL